MDDRRAGLVLRMLRRRQRWRQVDVARLAHVSQQTVSLVERGHADRIALRTVRRIFGTVDARLDLDVGWRGAALDRMLDEDHARLVARIIALLRRRGWETAVEVTYSIYGERGSVDVLAWRPTVRVILLVEAKTTIASAEETIRRLDVKRRLMGRIGQERLGWQPATGGRLLVIMDTTSARRAVERHGPVFATAFPARGSSVRAWLERPEGKMSGLIFMALGEGRGRRSSAAPQRARATVRPTPKATPDGDAPH